MSSSHHTAAPVTSPRPPHEAGLVFTAWIDDVSLTRECVAHAVASARQPFMIMPFEAVGDCIKASDQRVDLIVYHAHQTKTATVGDIAALRDVFASTALVVLSDASSFEPAVIEDLLIRGVSAFILSAQTSFPMLMASLNVVVSGGTFFPKEFLLYRNDNRQPTSRKPPRTAAQLTERELEVLLLLKQGKTNKLIAHELKLSESTVKVHVRNSLRKLGSPNRTHLAMIADGYIAGMGG